MSGRSQDAVIGELSDDGVAGVWEIPVPELGVTRLILYFEPRSNLEKLEKQVRTVFDRSYRKVPIISRARRGRVRLDRRVEESTEVFQSAMTSS